MNKFWLVWSPKMGVPITRHNSDDSASKDAARLAVKHPGEIFNVLESVGHYIKQEVYWQEHD